MNKLNLLLWGNLVLALGVVNWITQEKEDLLQTVRVVLLQVGRYDPRSLMQGDYMQLQYPICQTIEKRLGPGPQPDGVVVLALDKNNIGTFRRLYEEGETLAEDEQLLGYKIPKSFEYVDAPLRDEAGKLRRGALRDARIAKP